MTAFARLIHALFLLFSFSVFTTFDFCAFSNLQALCEKSSRFIEMM